MTGAEQAFRTMVRMAGFECHIMASGFFGFEVPEGMTTNEARVIWVENFPIYSSTFIAFLEERPDLQSHFDRLQTMWEATQ